MIDYLAKRYGSRNPYFEAMLKEGTNTSPIGAHSQGMSRLAFALLAGLERSQMDREEREAREKMATAPWNLAQQKARDAVPLPRPRPANALAAGEPAALSESRLPDWLRPYLE